MVRLLQIYSKHCIATKTLTDVRLRAESEHRETEVGGGGFRRPQLKCVLSR